MIRWMLSLFRDLRMRWLERESQQASQVLHQEATRQDRQANAIRSLRRGLLEEEARLAEDERRERRGWDGDERRKRGR